MVTKAALEGKTPRQALEMVRQRLMDAGCPDAAYDACQLLKMAAQGDPRLRQEPLNRQEATQLAELVQKRAERCPLQYLAGQWPFLDFTLRVGPGVLIPRADTEVVCEAAAKTLAGILQPQVLDLCAGSGALGLGIKRLVPSATVTAVEKSHEAMGYLRQNVANALPGFSESSPAVRPVLGDVFLHQRELTPGALDLIVSNPPYLTNAEMRALQPEVRFEPTMALEAGDDGLDFYRHIVANYQKALRPGGWLVLEIGWRQAGAVRALLLQNGWQQVRVQKDYGGNDRAVLAKAP